MPRKTWPGQTIAAKSMVRVALCHTVESIPCFVLLFMLCFRYLAVWEGWQSQVKGIEWMKNKRDEYQSKIDYINKHSSDPNMWNICKKIKEAQQVASAHSCRES